MYMMLEKKKKLSKKKKEILNNMVSKFDLEIFKKVKIFKPITIPFSIYLDSNRLNMIKKEFMSFWIISSMLSLKKKKPISSLSSMLTILNLNKLNIYLFYFVFNLFFFLQDNLLYPYNIIFYM